jgi:signal transduction histidine kinase/ActR/RegA family two-component response regulator
MVAAKTQSPVRVLLDRIDWSAHPLGEPNAWPLDVQVLVRLILCSKFPMWIAWGPELRMVYNDAYSAILGAKHPHAFAMPVREVWSEIKGEINPLFDQVMAGLPIPVSLTPFKIARGAQSEDVWFNFALTPVTTNSSEVLGIFCVITENTSLVDQVVSGARLEQLFAQAPGFMAFTEGPNHLIVNANYSYMQVVGHRPVLGRTFADALPDAVEQGYLALLDQVYQSGEPYRSHVANYAVQPVQGGSVESRVVDFILQPIFEPDGRVRGIFIQGSDVTEQALAESELKRVNEELARTVRSQATTQAKLLETDTRKDEFLAMLAHELRNPLAPISAAAELLQRAKLDGEQVRKTSQIIGRQVRHMTSLVDDLLDVSRVTRGLIQLDSVPLDVRQLVNEAIEQVTPLIQSRHHHLTVQLTPQESVVLGDRKRLVQVIANLLNNAAKYTQERGNLVVSVDVQESQVLIAIADDGIGMAPELLVRAFDLFAQAERSSDRSSGGLGLGLALVKSLLALHQGTVTMESPGLGKGSTAHVALPRLLAKSAGTGQVESSMQSGAAPMRILVVDDNADAASLLAMLLEDCGHHVLVEHGSRRALERAQNERPDICLLDIGLPEIDGNELARLLRGQQETAHCLLIAISGYGQESDRDLTRAAGFDFHLVKPVDTAELAALIAQRRNH